MTFSDPLCLQMVCLVMSRVFRTFKVLKKNMFLQCVLLEGVPNCSDLELPVLLTETTFCAP